MASKADVTECHFNWNLEPDGSQACKKAIDQIDIHLVDQTNTMTIPALLFRAFLYMSAYSPSRDPAEATKSLEEAKTEIDKLGDEEAKTGYNIVYYSLASVIRGKKMHVPQKEKEYLQSVRGLQRRRTPVTDAYIDATRAFALSRLGPARLNDCVKYFQRALDVSSDNVEWLVYFGIMHGRHARVIEGIPFKKTDYTKQERTMYEHVLQLDPNHAVANVFLGQVLFHEGNNKEAREYIEKALTLAPGNMRVLDRSVRFFRKSFYWTKALHYVNKALQLTHTDPDAMLYHQKALIYLRKYEEFEKGIKWPRDRKKLGGEIAGDPQSLLPIALDAIDKAINLSNSVVFGYDRALILEKQGKQSSVEKEYERLLQFICPEKPHDNVQIFLKFGSFLLRSDLHPGPAAMDRLKQGIEIAVKDCTELIEDQTNGNMRRFQGSNEKQIKKAIEMYERFYNTKIQSDENDPTALKNLGWLVHSVGNMDKQYTKTKTSALQFYQKAYQNRMSENESFADEVLEGLIDCHLTNGGDNDFKMAEQYVEELKRHNSEKARIKKTDLKLAKGHQLLANSKHQEARLTFLEAVEVGSYEACNVLARSLDSQLLTWGWDDVSSWQFRADCAKIIHCIDNDDDILTITQTLGVLSLHDSINNVPKEGKSVLAKDDIIERVKEEMELTDAHFGELRQSHFKAEIELLNDSEEGDIIKKCVEVITLARNKLDHAVKEFGSNKYGQSVSPGTQKVWKYPYINPGFTRQTVADEIQHRLEKQSKWKDFTILYPDLFNFLVKVQPATDPANYNWVAGMAYLVNINKHAQSLNQLNPDAEIGQRSGAKITQKFNLMQLARDASGGVEPICRKFYDSMTVI